MYKTAAAVLSAVSQHPLITKIYKQKPGSLLSNRLLKHMHEFKCVTKLPSIGQKLVTQFKFTSVLLKVVYGGGNVHSLPNTFNVKMEVTGTKAISDFSCFLDAAFGLNDLHDLF